jgi:Zn-dependent peptidase ImmA (M78 family)
LFHNDEADKVVEKVEINISRLRYLQDIFGISDDELLTRISMGLKNPIKINDIYSGEVKLSHLKRIDKIFDKGIYFYLDPANLTASETDSVFFRKKSFNSNLNIEDKKIVARFETLKHYISGISKLSQFHTNRKLPVYKVSDEPKKVAFDIRPLLHPNIKGKDQKSFLRALIQSFSDKNIYVFEFIEHSNKKERSDIDGFFLKPNTIVIKRDSFSYKREIFTLLHELGHYLIDDEEIDQLNSADVIGYGDPCEKWCYEFAYYFLAGEYAKVIEELPSVGKENNFMRDVISNISDETRLSELALYTRLLFCKKITFAGYKRIKETLAHEFLSMKEEEKQKRELQKALGFSSEFISPPKPIISPLFEEAIQSAYFEGVVSEYEACKKLSIKPEKFEKMIS